MRVTVVPPRRCRRGSVDRCVDEIRIAFQFETGFAQRGGGVQTQLQIAEKLYCCALFAQHILVRVDQRFIMSIQLIE